MFDSSLPLLATAGLGQTVFASCEVSAVLWPQFLRGLSGPVLPAPACRSPSEALEASSTSQTRQPEINSAIQNNIVALLVGVVPTLSFS